MRIGLFGGSFDPIHAGHVQSAKEARRRLALDRVYFLPTTQPPHKMGRRFAPAHARYAMVELAILGEPGLYASAVELTPGRPAYTVDTAEHFHGRWPEAELFLLIGGDSFVELPGWQRWTELVELVDLAVLARPGWNPERILARLPQELEELATSDRVHLLDNPPVEASSTEIRRRLSRGAMPPPGWLPELVLDYCLKYELYR